MDRLSINVGNQNNDGLGDGMRDAFVKVNTNFVELFNSNNMGASQAAVDVVSAALGNEISARHAASAALESHINNVSATVNVVSANQVSTSNRISAILTGNTAFSGTTYNFTNITNSTSTTNGTVVIAGGAGVAGNIFAGALYTDNYYYANGDPFGGGGGSGSGTVGSGTSGQLAYYQNSGTSVKGATHITFDTNSLTLTSGNLTTSTSTGALIITNSGGIGVTGNVHVGGNLVVNGSDIGAAVASINQEISAISNQVSVISNTISVLNDNLGVETSARIATSAALELHINQVSAALIGSSTINTAIDTISNSVSVLNDKVISIDATFSARINSVVVKADNISNAVSVVSNAVSVVSVAAANAISMANVVSNAVSTEIVNRASASAVLESHINTVSAAVNTVSNAVSIETANRVSADNALSNAVSATYAPKTNPTLAGTITFSDNNANTVVYLNSTKAVTTSNLLFFNGSNLGIGTNAPVNRLHVNGSISFGGNTAYQTISSDGGNNFVLNSWTGTAQIYQIASSEKMRIDANGNVGIGTSSPTELLAVSSSNTKPARIKSTSSSNNNKLILETSGVGSTMGMWITNSYGNTSVSLSETSGALVLATGGNDTGGSDTPTERMRIISTGNVGIGTSSPAYTLDVTGTARFTGNVTAPYFVGGATQAVYADLAENYTADANYEPGTVLQFGIDTEVTICEIDETTKAVGVVSEKPAYLMNSELSSQYVVPVALMGRIPCRVKGPINRGDLLVATVGGRARAERSPKPGSIIGKSLEDFYGDEGTIEIIVGLK